MESVFGSRPKAADHRSPENKNYRRERIAARVDWEVNTVSRITPINTPRALEPTCVTTENGPRIRPKKNIKRNAIKMIGHSRFWTADFVIVVHMQG